MAASRENDFNVNVHTGGTVEICLVHSSIPSGHSQVYSVHSLTGMAGSRCRFMRGSHLPRQSSVVTLQFGNSESVILKITGIQTEGTMGSAP